MYSKSKWTTKGIMKSIKYKDNLYKKMKITCPNSLDYQVIKTNLSTYSTILKKSKLNAKKNYFESIFKKYKNNTRKTWSTINDILSRKIIINRSLITSLMAMKSSLINRILQIILILILLILVLIWHEI